MSNFWDHYAKANDEIRTELIDKSWFQQKTGSTEFQDNVHAQKGMNAVENQGQGIHAGVGFENQQADIEADAHTAVYGSNPNQPQQDSSHGTGEAPEPLEQDFPSDDMDAQVLYGYDALDAPEEEIEPEL